MKTSRAKKRFTPEQIQDIVTSYQGGTTLQVLSERYECSRAPITRVLRSHEVPIRTNGEHNRAIIKDGKKFCSLGKHWVDLDNFYLQERYGTGYVTRTYACKPCMQDKWHQDWAKHVAKKFGISVDQYQSMIGSQDNLCAICKRPESRMLGDKPQRLSIDHNHTTGQVRGLLCNQCNSLIGMAKEDIDTLRNAIAYLELHNKQGSKK